MFLINSYYLLANKISISISGGYSTVSMQDVNKSIEKTADEVYQTFSGFGLSLSKKIQQINSGVGINLDFSYNVILI